MSATGLDQRFLGEVGFAAADIKRDEVNEITKKILIKYESLIDNPPQGKPFQECYDSKKLKPTAEWQNMYEAVKKEITGLGIPID